MLVLQAKLMQVEALIGEAVDAAAAGTLSRKQLGDLTEAFRAASTAGANESWLRAQQQRMERILDIQQASRTASALTVDSHGRRRAVRIMSPSLTVLFACGQECRTLDWSAYGILVADYNGDHLDGVPVTVTVKSAEVEGGGLVTGKVVWYSAASRQLAIEFLRPSLSIQIIKVRMMRSSLL